MPFLRGDLPGEGAGVNPSLRRFIAAALYNLAGTIACAADEIRPPRPKRSSKPVTPKPSWMDKLEQ